MDIVNIKEFKILGEDERGLTSEFSLMRKQADFVYITRKKGSISGNTYHKGIVITTNPKIFILLSGKILFSYRNIDQSEKISRFISAPALIEVLPNVTHKIEAIEDIMILECNSIQDIQNDKIRENV